MPTLQQALNVFLLIERRPLTTNFYRVTLQAMARAIGPDRDIRLVSFEDLLDYQAKLRQSRKSSTVSGYTAVIKVFFNWCLRRGYIDLNPSSDLPRVKQRSDPTHSRAIPSDELRRMVEYARLTNPRNYAMLLFLCDTGCRAGGLVSLTLDHLYLEDMAAVLDEKGGLYLRVMFGEETAVALELWLKKRPAAAHNYVWTGKGPDHEPLHRSAVEYMLAVLSERTGASRRWTPHSIRHAVGHAWAKAGIPPHVTQQKLGHRDIATTLNFYYPRHDPYVEVASRQLSLATLRDDEELRGHITDVTPKKRRAT